MSRTSKKVCLPGPSAYGPAAAGRALQLLLTQHGAACQGAFPDIPEHQLPNSVAKKGCMDRLRDALEKVSTCYDEAVSKLIGSLNTQMMEDSCLLDEP